MLLMSERNGVGPLHITIQWTLYTAHHMFVLQFANVSLQISNICLSGSQDLHGQMYLDIPYNNLNIDHLVQLMLLVFLINLIYVIALVYIAYIIPRVQLSLLIFLTPQYTYSP